MVESSTTPVSPISGARKALESFLKFTVDSPDLEKARLYVTRRTAESGALHAGAVPAGSTYTLGAEEADELGTRIPVSVKSPAAGGEAQEMTVPVVIMQEEGDWKIDLPATMERFFGGAMDVAAQAMGAVGQAMATAMAGVKEALSAGLGGDAGTAAAPRATKTARPRPAAKRKPAAKNKAPALKKTPASKPKAARPLGRKKALKKKSKPARTKKPARKKSR